MFNTYTKGLLSYNEERFVMGELIFKGCYLNLMKDRMVAILPMGHPLSGLPYLPLSHIEKEPFIIPSEGSDYVIRRILDKASIKPNIKFSSEDDYVIIAMVENGLDISILP